MIKESGFLISKLDAAVRQLRTAIVLFINDDDPVSIHSLACASFEILQILAKAQGISSQREQVLESIKPEFKQSIIKKFDEAKNFFKHGARDKSATIPFNSNRNEFVIWDAVLLYKQITKESIPLFQAYEIWFQKAHLDIYIFDSKQKAALEDITEDLDVKRKSEFFDQMVSLGEKSKRQTYQNLK